MNYLSEILGFHRQLLFKPLSARAMAFWYVLMYYGNAAHWQWPIILSESLLRGVLGLSHRQFLDARRELVLGGYILHKPRAGRRAPEYVVLSQETKSVVHRMALESLMDAERELIRT